MVNIIQFIQQCSTGFERKLVELNKEEKLENELRAIEGSFAV